jgi:tetratricopeptide (TPR) repeat protein
MAAEGDVERARSLSEDAVRLGREVARTESISFVLAVQGHVALVAGDFARARRAYEECLTLREYGDSFGSVPTYEVLFALADIALAEGKLEEARSRLAEAKGCFTFFKWRARGPVIEIGLARVARAAGDLNGSDALSASGMTAIYDLGHKPLIATCLEERAALAAARGDVECAAKIYGAAEALREAVHAPVPMLERRRYASEVESVASALDAWAEGREMSVEDAVELASFDVR